MCPKVNISPKPFKDNGILRVSKYMDPTLLKLNLQIIDQCADPIMIQEIVWESNVNTTMYTLSNDSLVMTFKDLP